MHIKTLVLDNFKSFGRRTKIPFYEDFSTVSGPNGSGKSNIIDAVLFALGLARSHGIRAEKLTDLIYNPGDDGTETGPNEASVEVVLDNSDRTLTREQIVTAAGTEDITSVEEIRIKRRVKRTDDNYYSYYYLNDRSVNLSDIRDLLSQAGVTPEGYNVVMQGDVTGITSMTPYRRREIIDEIAGVAEFDAKKVDALDELEVVKDRIDEAELRIEEKQTRLDQLEDERDTALEYQELREEKQEFEGYLKAAELKEKRTELADTEDRIESHKTELAAQQTELDERAGRVVRLEEELQELNREIERKGEDEQLALQREIEQVKGEIARINGEIDASQERIQEAEQERRQAFVEIDRKQEQLEELEDEIRERKLEKASIKADLQNKQDDLDSVQSEIDEIGTEYDELKTALDSEKSKLETARDKKNELQREQDRLLDEARRRSNELAEIEEKITDAEENIPELQAKLDDLHTELSKATQNKEEIESVISDLKTQKTDLKTKLTEVEDELRGKQQEYAELEAAAKSNGDSSYGRSVTTILNSDLDGIHGTLGQLGSVADQYAEACETAAGGRLANIVVDTDETGQQCIEYLKQRNAGRATFLPLNKMDKRSLPNLPDRTGVIDFAYNLVEFDDDYETVFSYALGDTLVVDTLQTARALMGQYRIVTLSGDLVQRSGAMSGGSGSGARYSFSSSKGKLQQVAEDIEALESDRNELTDEIATIDGRLDDARDRRSDATDDIREIKSGIASTESERNEIEAQINDLEDRKAEIEGERDDVDEQMQEIETSIASCNTEIEDLQEGIDRIQNQLADSRIPELSEKADQIKGEITTLNGRIDDIDASLNELQLEQEYTEDAVADLHDRIETAQNRKAAQEEQIERLEGNVEDKEQELDEKREAVEELEDELAGLKSEREDLRETLQEAKGNREEQAELVSKTKTRIESLSGTAEQLTRDIESLEEIVAEHDPDEIPDHDEVRSNISELERSMAELEPVNMLAIDEFDRVNEELTDLRDRRTTLVEERDGIHERIERYEQEKKNAFMTAYNAIDTYFQDIFERLSNGTGELHLENPEDPFEAGLTMRAKPGDKPVQRLDAMSGGEKSLTALAFIFAIQRHNPAPFYALDEIDAFLDAANADRVGEMLDELADTAQFIVVSHRQALLERSERAIGVTMQHDNMSAVTGIALADGGGRGD